MDRDEVFEACEIVGVACVYSGVVSVRGCGDEQIHDSCSWLAAGLDDACGQSCVAVGDGFVDGERVESALNGTEPFRARSRTRWVTVRNIVEKPLLGTV